ncbi:MAG: MBL fold metallo-hydrolase [Candidatus Bathyarchaeota archaeon]|nr:MBL fold metallo-hydrolase [Candidatus Bathyarchaeota archaeon]
MIAQKFTVGKFFTNCYVIHCEKTKEAIIVDPGVDSKHETEALVKAISESKLEIRLIVNTHGHPDHTCGNGVIKEKFNAQILIHEEDKHLLGKLGKEIAKYFGFQNFSPPADVLLHDGDVVKFGVTSLKVIHTPGHSHGSISLLGKKEIFTGDTIFAGSIGRTDFPGSSQHEMLQSLKKIASLPDYLEVYPGHGPATTIAEEKRTNPFLCGI